MDEFRLTIRLGNDAMQTGQDVAGALREVADRIEYDLASADEGPQSIRDLNGNTVGEYEIHS